MPITVIFHGPDGEKVYNGSMRTGKIGDMDRATLEKGWKSLVDCNLDALLAACENPHPYVPD